MFGSSALERQFDDPDWVVCMLDADQQLLLHAQALPWRDEIVAVGLARGIPNFKGEQHQHAEFKDVIGQCRGLGWQMTAHVGKFFMVLVLVVPWAERRGAGFRSGVRCFLPCMLPRLDDHGHLAKHAPDSRAEQVLRHLLTA